MTDTPDPAPSSALRKFFGVVLITIGLLMATLCGLCTLGVGGFLLVSALEVNGRGAIVSFMLFYTLLLGVLPTAIGVALFYVGRRLYRSPKDMS